MPIRASRPGQCEDADADGKIVPERGSWNLGSRLVY